LPQKATALGSDSYGKGKHSTVSPLAILQVYLGKSSRNYICWPRKEPERKAIMNIELEK
jgi:hypothetical protein